MDYAAMALAALTTPADTARVPYEACALCGSANFKTVGEVDCSNHPLWNDDLPKKIEWMSCGQCGHRFTSGYFGEAALAALFRKANAHQQPGYDVQPQRLVCSRIVQRAAALSGGVEGRWLDVGFGNGALLAAAEEFGYEASGLDIRGAVVKDMRGYGYAAVEADLAQISDDGKFSIVSLADVLEHMPFPAEGLAHAHRLLADGGLVFVSMPNTDTFVWRVLERQGKNPYCPSSSTITTSIESGCTPCLKVAGLSPASTRLASGTCRGWKCLPARLAPGIDCARSWRVALATTRLRWGWLRCRFPKSQPRSCRRLS